MTVVYVALLMTMLIGFASLGVDWAEVQLAKTQLLAASDAASRAAAANIGNGVTAAQNAAVLYGGAPVALSPENRYRITRIALGSTTDLAQELDSL